MMLFAVLFAIVSIAAAASFQKSHFHHATGQRKRSHINADSSMEWKQVTECVEPVFDAGHYFYKSLGHDPDTLETCGIYIITSPDQIIEVEFEGIEVSCQSGLVAYFDGWEMNGKIFPSDSDHELPLKERITEICGKENSQNLKFRSSQNAALIQYRIPKAGDGFSVKISIAHNPNPCNILMSELSGIFTLTNYGNGNRNCTLSTLLFPAHFQIREFKVGQVSHPLQNLALVKKTKIIVKDDLACGHHDYVEVGGSSDLETTDLEAKEDICTWPLQKSVTILCGSSTLRLVSSGAFANSVTVSARAAQDTDLLDTQNNSILVCPQYS